MAISLSLPVHHSVLLPAPSSQSYPRFFSQLSTFSGSVYVVAPHSINGILLCLTTCKYFCRGIYCPQGFRIMLQCADCVPTGEPIGLRTSPSSLNHLGFVLHCLPYTYASALETATAQWRATLPAAATLFAVFSFLSLYSSGNRVLLATGGGSRSGRIRFVRAS